MHTCTKAHTHTHTCTHTHTHTHTHKHTTHTHTHTHTHTTHSQTHYTHTHTHTHTQHTHKHTHTHTHIGRLGYSPHGGSDWCSLKIEDKQHSTYNMFVVIFGNDLWIYSTFFMVTVLYFTTHCYIKFHLRDCPWDTGISLAGGSKC